ncbi:hypothetical protein [Jeotgalibaca porci]|uniref:hypothetical protein n=1 Tax=Jeotgalibaca porci TaxID=1868793 RepID=UPI0035A0ACA4
MKEYIMIAKIEKYNNNEWFKVTHVNLSTGEIMIDDRLGFTHKTFDINTDVELKIVEEVAEC